MRRNRTLALGIASTLALGGCNTVAGLAQGIANDARALQGSPPPPSPRY